MDARPDKEEMEEAINNFLLLLEKQEKKGFKDLATILSQMPKPVLDSVRSMSVADAVKQVFSQRHIKITAISRRYVHTIGSSPVPTRSGPQKKIIKLGYPGIA